MAMNCKISTSALTMPSAFPKPHATAAARLSRPSVARSWTRSTSPASRADKLTSRRPARFSARKVEARAYDQFGSFDSFDEGMLGPEEEGPDEKVFSYLTSDGVFQIREPVKTGPGGMSGATPRRRPRLQQEPLPSLEEQGICVASTFRLAATNGRDLSRRIIWHGYARSAFMLADAVEDTVLWHGGLVAVRECSTVETFTHVLNMTIVFPRLWSSRTPELDTLSYAIAEGGGIIEGVKQQWHII